MSTTDLSGLLMMKCSIVPSAKDTIEISTYTVH